MRNFTQSIRKYFFAGLAMCISIAAVAQEPGAVSTNISGTYVDVSLINYGLFGQYRAQAASSAASGVDIVEFPIAVGDFSSVWRAYTAGQVLIGYDTIIDPITQPASARYNTAGGGGGQSILLPAVTAGNYYTINVQTNQGNNDDTMAILETTYYPDSFVSMSLPIDTNEVGPSCSPTVIVVLAAPPSAGEYVYLRYSVNGFADSSSVILMTVSGDTATCQLPAYPAGTNIQYYALSSPNGSLIATGPASAYYDCQTLNLITGSIGNNFRYTVKTLPVPSVSITASANPICSGTTDTFAAHGVNTGTVPADYQWYKNGAPVGTNDSIYTDAGLNNNDSVWVAMTANLVCSVIDTSSHVIIGVLPLSTYTQFDTICQNSSFTENGHAYTSTGTYMDTFTNASVTGCDSIVTTNLYVYPLATYTQYDTICQGGSFTENGNSYTSTGTYMDTFTNASVTGCDSIVTTALNVYPLATYTQYDTICQGGSFVENGNSYTSTGTYMDTFTNASVTGCDSIVTTNLYVYPLATYTQYDTICQGGSFAENGNIYTSTGTYMDTFTNASVSGCDSMVTTNLYVYPLATYTQFDTICQGGSFTENGNSYTSTGTYMDTFSNASVSGCDSIVTTNLYVNPLATYTQYDTVCQGGSFTENGHTYTSTGTYMDTFTNASVTGCDSIVTTALYVYPLATYTQYDTICQGGSFVENGNSYTSTGTYMDTFTNASITGCDSIVTTALYVYPLSTYTQYDTICQGGSFVENGNSYTSTGTYMDTFTNASVTGCDSIVTTNLYVYPLATYTQYDTICQGGSFAENGNIYTSTGTYMDTFTNASVSGCDSMVTTNLYVYPLATYTQFDTICQGGSFTENGNSYTSTGTYTDTFTNASVTGCDSIVTTALYVYPLSTYTQFDTICQGGSFMENGHAYTSTGTYMDTFSNASVSGCDSIVTTALYVYPLATYTQYDTVCQGGSFTENGHSYTSTGTYMDTFTNASVTGCDSIVTTALYVYPLATYTQYDTVCQGGSFTENGHTYTSTGTYMDTFTNASVTGCDSIVTTALYVYPLATYTQYDTICQGGSFVENGNSYTSTGTYMDTFTNASITGCDSIVTTALYVYPLATYTQYDTICQGGSFTENGNSYTSTGTYMDTFTNASVTGCDSIVTTALYVYPLATYTQYDTICQGGSFAENGNSYTSTGTYMDTFTNASVSGCDSIVTTNLYVYPLATYTQYDTICQGGNFTENGHTYTATGTYMDTFTNASVTGCDSIVTTALYVYPLATYTQYDTICQGGSFMENGNSYTSTGTYMDTFTNASVTGCDSIVTTALYVYPLSTYTQYDTICQGGSFMENGHAYTSTGTYMDTFTNASITGCDSIVTTALYVYPLATYTQYDTVCQGGSFTENGNSYTSTGTYMDTFTNASVTGCDSIVTTALYVYPLATYTQYDTVCQGGSFAENGNSYTSTGTYMDTFTNASVTGCDSIVTTNLYVYPLATYTQYDTICQGGSFTENGNSYTSTGTYMDTFTNASVTGCDSIVTTNLYVYPLATYTQYDTICQGGSFTENGNSYTSTGTYMDTFTNASVSGCDSIVTTNLYVNPLATYTQYDTICQGGSFTENGNSYTSTGTYMDTFTNASVTGCDSIVTTNLYVYPLATYTQFDTICQGGSFTENGNSYTSTGTYMDTFTNASVSGCDSIVTTNLYVNPLATYTQFDTICQGGSFAENGNSYTSTGTYMDTFTNASVTGCDSIMTTNLYVYPLATYTQYDTFCQGGSFTENGHTYTSTGTYMDTLTNASVTGCDSIVTTNLYVNPLATYTQFDTICQGGSFTENGNIYTSTGTYMDTFTNASVTGCDSIVTTNLYVYLLATYTQYDTICQGGSFTENGNSYTSTGTYMDTFTNASVTGCDSIVTTNLYVYPLATYTQFDTICQGGSFTENGNSYTSTGTYMDTFTNASVTGCDSIVTTNLYVNPLATYTQYDTICQGGSFTENGNSYTSTGTYMDTFTNASVTGCDSIVTTNLYVYPLATYTQYDTICQGGSFTENGHTYTSTGTYMDTFTNASITGCDSIVTTALYVYPLSTYTQYDTICQGGSFVENGNIYTSTGTYMDTFTNASVTGCDSIVTTALYVYPLATYTQYDTICQGGSFTENGNSYASTGTYMDTFTNASVTGCDSIVTTNLFVNPLSAYTQFDTICQNSSFMENGHSYTSTGTYMDTFYNASVTHCDSIVTTNLYVYPLATYTQFDTICQGSSFMENGHMYTSTGTYIDTFYNASVTGCDSIVTTNLFVAPLPIVNLGPNVTMCGGNIKVDAGNARSTFSWSDGTTTEIDTISTSGTYTVTVTNAFGCTASGSITVYIKSPPVVNLGPAQNICGDSTTLDAGNPGNTYMWTGGSTGEYLTVYSSGLYTVTVTDTASLCSASDSVQININSAPTVSLGDDTSLCGGQYTITASGSPATYLWSNNATTSSITVSATGNYSVTATSSAGCTASASVLVTIYPQPNLGPDIADSICPGSTVDLYNYFVNSGLTLTYSTPNPASVDTGVYWIVGTNSNGCSDSVMVTITQRQKPNLGGNQTDSVCAGYTLDLTKLYPNNGYTTYTWNVPNDTAVGPGVYQLIVTNASGCSDTATVTVTQRAKPIVTIPSYPNQCSTNPDFILTGATPAGGTYYINYVEDSLFSPSTLGAGSYHILYIYTNASGCTDSASSNVTVWPQPQITDTIALPTSCTGSPLIDLSTYFSPAGGIFSGPGVSGVYFYPTLAPVGSDSITYIYTDQNGCMDTAGRRIDITPAVKVTLHTNQSNLTICQGQSITFIASGAVDYQFFVNDSPVTTLSTEDTFTTSGLSNHDQIMVYGTNGCSSDSSDFTIIDVNPLPTVMVGPDTTIALGQTVQLYSNATGATPLVYLWTPDSSLTLTNIPNPVYSGPDTIIFQLMVTDANGCTAVAYDTINVYVPDNVQLPNFITPNGDGINDAWTLNDKIDLAGSHLVIFNRWGEVVYETWNYNNDWKGTYQSSGKTVPDGTYYYVLTVPTQNHTYKGPINVFDSNGN